MFLELHRAQAEARFDGNNPYHWLRTATFRITRDVLKHRERQPVKIDQPRVDGAADEKELNPEERLEACEEKKILADLLASLPATRRRVFILFMLEEMTAPEIAKALGLPLTTVTARLRIAREEFDAAITRWRARNAWKQGAFLLPFRLGARALRGLFATLCARATAWSMKARSTLGRALAMLKAASMSLAVGAGVSLVLGAAPAPERGPSAPSAEEAPPIVAAVAMPAALPTTVIAAAAKGTATNAGTLRSAPGPKGAAGPSTGAPSGRQALLEQLSLDRIQALSSTDPAAARAAIERHRKAFPGDLLRRDRRRIEALAQVGLASPAIPHPLAP